MIEFKGELTGDCKKAAMKRLKFVYYVSYWPLAIFIFIITITFAFLFNRLLLLFCFLPLITFLYPIFEKDTKKRSYFNTITIDENGEMVYEDKDLYITKHIDFVESVIDHGEYYEIVFIAEEDDKNFRCQKDLLTQGTIEEFDALFEGKLVRV